VGTVPDQAKALLTAKPSLAYSLIKLMVKMNLLNAEVLQVHIWGIFFRMKVGFLNFASITQKTLANAANPQTAQQTPPMPVADVPNGHTQSPTSFQPYSVPQSYQPPSLAPQPVQPPPVYPSQTIQAQVAALPPSAQAMLAAIPEDQRVSHKHKFSVWLTQVNRTW
jgi:cleavage stimulation factor subunit 2